jgi:hypothetical protein
LSVLGVSVGMSVDFVKPDGVMKAGLKWSSINKKQAML